MRMSAGLVWSVAGAFVLALLILGFSTLRKASVADAAKPSIEQRLDELQRELDRTRDIQQIERITRAYGYYVDKALWDQVAALFTDDCRIEISGRGVYLGRKGAERFFQGSLGGGRIGLAPGQLFNHIILQGVDDVSADGKTGHGRWRALMQIGSNPGFAMWGEGTYENVYKKVNGVWMISDMHFYSTYYTPYPDGWGKTTLPNNGPHKQYPPDLPPSVDYDVLPGHYVPPFHYPNPVTGQPWSLQDTEKYSTHGMSPPPMPPPPARTAEPEKK